MEHLKILASIFLLSVLSIKAQPQTKGTVTDIDGNIYQTIVIGKYEWMVSNLKTTTYNDGKKIPNITSNKTWIELSCGAYCWYNNDDSIANIYGALYNLYAVNTGNLCPIGWRVPSDEEWNYLEGFTDTKFGLGNPIWNGFGSRGTDVGQKLKSKRGWCSIKNGDDIFGFSALPGGERISKGRFLLIDQSGFWWSSSETDKTSAKYRCLIYFIDNTHRNSHPKTVGFSVRCLKNIILK
jgi:uncharacterized protein (TIGR02145 family)